MSDFEMWCLLGEIEGGEGGGRARIFTNNALVDEFTAFVVETVDWSLAWGMNLRVQTGSMRTGI
jgi:hypothetical protein